MSASAPVARPEAAPRTAGLRGLRLFASPRGEPHRRRAGDVLVAVPALLGLLMAIVVQPPDGFEGALSAFLDGVPSWLGPVWAFLYDLLALWAVLLVVIAAAARRWRVVAHAVLAVALVAGGAMAAARLALGDWPDPADALAASDSPAFPAMRAAEAGAVVITVSAHLVRPLERVSRGVLWLGMAGALIATPASPSGVLAAALLAVLAAAVVRLAVGTSIGRPGLAEVRGALDELGVTGAALEPLERQEAGVFLVGGRDGEGRPLTVKVYGRDAYDTRLLARLWRSLWYRETGPAPGLGRSRSVDHEAFQTLLARNGGVRTLEVVTAGTTAGDDSLLVLRGYVSPLADLPPDRMTEAGLREWWTVLARLHAANIAHLRLDTTTVALVDGEPGIVDFGSAVVAPSGDQLLTDRAQLLAATAATAGEEQAVAAAAEALGTEGLGEVLAYLQPAAFGTRLRQAVKAAGLDMEELRSRAAEASGATLPDPVRLRRVTVWSVVQLGLLVLAATAVLGFFGGVDWDQFADALRDASWGILAVGFVVAQTPRLAQAVGTLGSVPARIPYWPVYAMQLTTGYLNVALPSYVGRMAITIRFFQKQALSPAIAVTSGAIDSAATVVVQAVLMGLILLFSSATISLQLTAPDEDGGGGLLWVLVVLAIAAVLAFALVPRLRRLLVGWAREWVPQVRDTFGALRGGNKLALLIGGNVATEILFAASLGLFCLGMGYEVSLAQLLLINISVSLLSSFIPVPGGIGVVEFGLTFGLTAAGMPEEAALAAVLCHRVATFYAPPLWGFFAMRWLQRNNYL